MQTKHTPGPWITSITAAHSKIERQDTTIVPDPDSGRDFIIATCEYGVYGPQVEGEAVANAALIAAAPDLLAACEALIAADTAICDNLGSKSDQAMQRIAALDIAAAAIARAKGE